MREQVKSSTVQPQQSKAIKTPANSGNSRSALAASAVSLPNKPVAELDRLMGMWDRL